MYGSCGVANTVEVDVNTNTLSGLNATLYYGAILVYLNTDINIT